MIYNKSTDKVLNQIAKDEGFTDYKICSYGQISKGQGLTGELYFVNIKSEDNIKQLELLIKEATKIKKIRDYFPVNALYKNEALFYNIIWPKFTNLQQDVMGKMIFDNVPKCYGSEIKPGEECIVLENLRSQGFETFPKSEYLDKKMLEMIFKKYGELHALSFAYKMKDSTSFEITCGQLIPYWTGAKNIIPLKVSIQTLFQKCVSYTSKYNSKLQSKMEKINENPLDAFIDSNYYKGKYGVLLHGDCWSNNMMFQFDSSRNPIDMKFIDFQVCQVGSPVFDLAYSFYSGGSEEIFNELDHFLEIYSKSLSDMCQQLNCNKYISLDELKIEWKEYSKFGWIMALIILTAKLVKDETNLDLLVMLNEFEKRNYEAHLEASDEDEIEKRTMSILNHLDKCGYL
ncbi:uncharacterized protein LOC130443883 [Diorhabda sublineata]|uniref:uncharacterized protein LOC130443883 n=1 Tax=Diorhabda sublineata TaxID=1163346 RepID=UPI0024E0AB6D|nr:uncharacterized protein LOC130443883 [Diorhabda sublineata]XP_056634740.1 uncharacterized protein LOC130443883 [Diorhabda sublineata]